MSVSLVQKSVDALEIIGNETDDTTAASINRALQFYAWWIRAEANGYTHFVRDRDGEMSQILRVG